MTKLGTSTYGSTSKPIYWNAGVPAAISATVGSSTKPIYSNSGTLTACDLDSIDTIDDFNVVPSTGVWHRYKWTTSTLNSPSKQSMTDGGTAGTALEYFGASSHGVILALTSGRDIVHMKKYTESTFYDWVNCVNVSSLSLGSSTTPIYISSTKAVACSAMMPLSGSTFTGVAYAQTNTSYTTYQLRNIAFTTSTPSSLTNGNVCMVYS